MTTNNNNNTAISVPSVTVDTFAYAGIKLDTSKAKAARATLSRDGSAVSNLSDVMTVAVYQASNSLKASDKVIKDVCKIAGIIRMTEAWRNELDDNGKPYKSENAFLRSVLPGYQTSTVSLYADVGATVYIPAMHGELDDLPGVADLNPGTAKMLLSALKDAQKRAALPAALSAVTDNGKQKLSQKAISAALKSLNDTSATPDNISTSAGQIADELSGGSISSTVFHLISFAYNGDDDRDGDLTAVVLERDTKDFISLLLKASKDTATATAVCDSLYKLVKSAK